MARIYRRGNMIEGVVTKQNEKNRKRNIILNFRVSEEEKKLILKRIELSGLAKADFFIMSCLHQEIVTYGNVKTFNVIKQQIVVIDEHIMEISKSNELDIEILESFRTILEMLNGLDKESKENE